MAEPLVEVVAAYEVEISGRGYTAADLVGSYASERDAFERVLTRSAARHFGPGFAVKALEAVAAASVHATVLLGLRYPVRAVAATAAELQRFAGEVEAAIAEGLEEAGGDSLQVVARLDESSVLAQGAPKAEQPWERVAPVLAALGTGLGVLGFVTFVGGAVLWARFTGAGIAAEQALSVVPSQDIVVTGAAALTPALAAALVATAALFVVRTISRSPPAAGDAPSSVERWSDEIRASLMAVFVLLVEGVALALTLGVSASFVSLLLAAVGVGLALLVGCVAYLTARFAYLAASTFLAVSLFLGGVTFYGELIDADVRAAAVVRKNQKAVIGFYVAEGSGRVFLGRLEIPRSPTGETVVNTGGSRIVAIAKAEVTDLAVGPAKPLEEAYAQASALANELCGLQVLAPRDDGSQAVVSCWHFPPGKTRP